MANVVGCVCRRRALASVVTRPPIRPSHNRHHYSNHAWPCPSRPIPVHNVRHNVRFFSDNAVRNHDTNSAVRQVNEKNGSEKNRSEASVSATIPPPKGTLSIVFTDIVKSTELWEEDAEAMAKGMKIHDDIVRNLTQIHHGYEVKQNGDGFMIAFSTAISALQFCLAVQQQLLEQRWPDRLSELGPGRERTDNKGNVLFRGLRLRMSAHWGEPVCVWNDVIQRMDYLGPAVNRAARFIQVTEGGQLVVSEEFLLEIQRSTKSDDNNNDKSSKDQDLDLTQLNLQDLHCPQTQQDIVDNKNNNSNHKEMKNQRFEVKLLGNHQFKGLPEPQKLYFIIPESLHGRLDLWPKHKYIAGSKGNIIASSDHDAS